jgi:putative sigma-54 modulation protein
MQIAIRSDGVQIPQALRESVELRVRFALARFGEHIGQVTTRFWALSASSEKGHKRCLIEVQLKLPKTIKAETTDRDVLVAVERAVNRLARSIIRELMVKESSPTSAPAAKTRLPSVASKQRGQGGTCEGAQARCGGRAQASTSCGHGLKKAARRRGSMSVAGNHRFISAATTAARDAWRQGSLVWLAPRHPSGHVCHGRPLPRSQSMRQVRARQKAQEAHAWRGRSWFL